MLVRVDVIVPKLAPAEIFVARLRLAKG